MVYTIRDVEDGVWCEFKARCAKNRVTMKDALAAMVARYSASIENTPEAGSKGSESISPESLRNYLDNLSKEERVAFLRTYVWRGSPNNDSGDIGSELWRGDDGNVLWAWVPGWREGNEAGRKNADGTYDLLLMNIPDDVYSMLTELADEDHYREYLIDMIKDAYQKHVATEVGSQTS